ncbi:hypothetical protein TIFTF001_001495 [Ficus carica]|uniref:Glycosyltransferase n=1 Tax=Ficus carica TaxID=3494 RepID=A0AA88CRT2_FICCA|nr:hypothetical protein TIFTF001_001495 [Ficus carica]
MSGEERRTRDMLGLQGKRTQTTLYHVSRQKKKDKILEANLDPFAFVGGSGKTGKRKEERGKRKEDEEKHSSIIWCTWFPPHGVHGGIGKANLATPSLLVYNNLGGHKYNLPLDTATTSSYIDQLSQTTLRISFFTPPSIDLPQSLSRTEAAFEFIKLNASHAVHVSYHPHIPAYYYFTSSASALAVILYLPAIHHQTTKSFRELGDTLLHFPGLPPLKASDMPDAFYDLDDPTYRYFLNVATYLPKSKGIIINTFDSLEPRVIEALMDGACVPNQDLQPEKSVVLLCFGSRGTFSEVQLKEMAMGLERSSQKFLWVVESPPDSNMTEPNLESAILRHGSIGGFVTHCGWNSVVGAVSCGVPMVAWPLYAEQRMNSVVLVEEMKLAMPLEKVPSSSSSLGEELVTSQDMEKKVRFVRAIRIRGRKKSSRTEFGSESRGYRGLD